MLCEIMMSIALAGEYELLARLSKMMNQNKVWRSYLGMGYYDCRVPTTIQRNIFENPGWYVQYNILIIIIVLVSLERV